MNEEWLEKTLTLQFTPRPGVSLTDLEIKYRDSPHLVKLLIDEYSNKILNKTQSRGSLKKKEK